jgi:hypothetical protein
LAKRLFRPLILIKNNGSIDLSLTISRGRRVKVVFEEKTGRQKPNDLPFYNSFCHYSFGLFRINNLMAIFEEFVKITYN